MSSSSGISSSSLSNSSFYHRERGGGAAGEAASASSIKLLDEILEEDNSSFDGGGRSRYDHKYFYDNHLLHFLPNVEDIVFSHLPTSTPPCKRFARSVVKRPEAIYFIQSYTTYQGYGIALFLEHKI